MDVMTCEVPGIEIMDVMRCEVPGVEIMDCEFM